LFGLFDSYFSLDDYRDRNGGRRLQQVEEEDPKVARDEAYWQHLKEFNFNFTYHSLNETMLVINLTFTE